MDIEQIIDQEYPKTREDLLHRRLGIVDPQEKEQLIQEHSEIAKLSER